MSIIKIMINEFENRYPNLKHPFLRSLLYYYRDTSFRVLVLSRICTKNKGVIGKYCKNRLLIKYGMVIARTAILGDNLWFPHYNGIVIGRDAVVGKNCIIYHQVTIGQNHDRFPVIGDNVVIYSGAKLFGDIHIGNNVIVGANSVVTHDIPDNCVVAGVPAKIISILESRIGNE